MADEAEKSEKTEPATPYKLEEAKKKGSVVKSMEINSLFALTTALILLVSIGEAFVKNVLKFCRTLFLNAGQINFELDRLLHSLTEWVFRGLEILSPIVAVMMLIGIMTTIIQTGPVFSFFPLKPDIKRLNPIQGFKKFISIKLLFETLKNLIKLTVFTVVVYVTVSGFIPDFNSLFQRMPNSYVPFYIGLSSTLIFRLILALALIALLDLLFSRWEYSKNLRMTRRELKDEIKRREGDPQIRSKRRSLEKELRERSKSLSNIPKADVIITNPTHFAVVIRYDRSTMIAPIVTGKGTGEMAHAIRREGYRHGVPVIQAPSLTRLIYKKTKMEQPVPQECFVALAKVFRQAYQIRQKQSFGNSEFNKAV